MMASRAILAALFVSQSLAAAQAAIDVSAPRPITHRVTVQLIQTALDDGTSPATVFGNATQRADIEADIDTIWAQAGIDIAFLPNVVRYNDTFAYQGTDGSGTRSQADLNAIRVNAGNEGGILNSDASVLNMFMVNVVPGFKPLEEGSTAGIARIAANGIAAFNGDNLLTFPNGIDAIAGVMAHEIGHNLGLNHTAGGEMNLMSPGGSTEHLTSSQIDIVFRSTSFPKLLPVVLAGDYDGDGTVDAADYTVWRDSLNQSGTALPADGNNNGRIDIGDYTVWKNNFGEMRGTGGASAIPAAVPEPASAMLVIAASIAAASLRRSQFARGTTSWTLGDI